MFYSEQLLAKTGPLARVWLASNVERKLSKSQILQSDITNSVNVIVDQGTAPMALRLSGQLMLGVVRIYGRKARYLLDDCNEALIKIRMTFKSSNNHDLPNQTTTTNITLELPNDLTMDDLFPALDFGIPTMTQQPSRLSRESSVADDDWLSSLNPQTQSQIGIEEGIHNADLGIDIGADIGMEDTTISMNIGRGEATPRPDDPFAEPAIDEGEGLDIDLGEDVPMPDVTRTGDRSIAGIEDPSLDLGGDETAQLRAESPLSEADPDLLQELDRTFTQQEEIEEVVAAQRQSRRQRPLVADTETMLHNSELKQFAQDRSRILKPLSLLPQDPELLALLEMQRTGGFVTNAMNDGFTRGLAPELQGLLTFDIAYRSGQKRKRDSGIADITSEDEHSDKSPRLERPSAQPEEGTLLQEDEGIDVRGDSPLAQRQSTMYETHEPIQTDDPTLADVVTGEDEEGIFGDIERGFDETTMPLVHPADSGPISVSTRHAVHLLRETFGGTPSTSTENESPQSQTRKSVLLQDLIPEGRTSKDDATKMFFEILVLATKDAIKVEQDSRELGLPIRVRAKRGLWGDWAEPSSTQAETGGQEVSVGA